MASTVASIISLVEDEKLDEFCCDGSDDEVSDLVMNVRWSVVFHNTCQ